MKTALKNSEWQRLRDLFRGLTWLRWHPDRFNALQHYYGEAPGTFTLRFIRRKVAENCLIFDGWDRLLNELRR